ncbi:3-ketoacyl-ACP reductase [Chelativorans salis]|uniref:3-ketoacyl-ACP reductase n=1 Tax=Chelativorans salis TaxID=2978478 RepID=A0ABT2LLY2_9HYPH|nr:3-ketoacyl-ACP reductase [Chelativorans sp. EGI FJ00035]MCT7374194.1 3-ketoacyl-ACP reductase [Chelativorans sp. EGI FJ00035]
MPEGGVAIVTGAARGIGRAIAMRLAAAGYDLVLNDLKSDDLESAASEIENLGRCAVLAPIDISAPDAPEAVISAALDRFGRVDGLVNNAGVSVASVGDILDVTPQSYDRCANVNAKAVFFMTQCIGRYFVKNTTLGGPGRFIISITSSNASAISVDRSEYCVSKAAASMVTQCFAARLANHGVGVYEIRPGVIETDMTKPRLERFRKRIDEEDLTAIKRLGSPDDVAETVITLARAGLPYCVGQILAIDGGLAMRRY